MISNKDLRVEGSNLIINGEKYPLDPAVDALIKRANTVQGKLSALDTKLDAIEALEKTASGNPISLTGVAAAYAMDLSMTIEPIQSGSGDPSPTNVRPISGLTEGKVTRTGKNLLPTTADFIKTNNSSITWNGNVGTYAGITFEILTNEKGQVTGIKANGTATSRISLIVSQLVKGYGDTKANVTMTEAQGTDNTFLTAIWIQGGNAFTGRLATFYTRNDYNLNIDNRTENCYLGIGIANGYTANNLIISPMIRLATETDPTFEPYTAATATITFGQTVYGGSVNFKTGEVTVTHEYLASYNGESINEPWLSSIDKYVSGATPTTGAQVVYPLTTPTTLTLTPAELELLKGVNTVSGNGANINLSYIGR